MFTLAYSADIDKVPHYMAVHQSLQFANIIRQKSVNKIHLYFESSNF